MSRNKSSKIIKWEYVTEPYDVTVYEPHKMVKRVHAPLSPSLSRTQTGNHLYLHLRPCVRGLDEDGAVVKYLYCTRDGRFFVRNKNGWIEIKPGCFGNNPKSKGGGSDCPQMRRYGCKPAHRCVAFAWLDVPEDVKLQLIGVNTSTKWEVDHLNTDHKNWTADNLQWVTVEENRRRGKIARRMRKIGLNPKLLTRTLLLGIYGLNQYQLDVFINGFLYHCNQDPSPLSVDAIRLDVARALDDVKAQPNPNL